MSIVLWAAVVLIGGTGSVLRFLTDGAVSARVDQHSAGRDFPLGTLAVNVSGAVILGLLTGLALGHDEACWPARPRSARTPRSRPGCWKPSG
jgi:fluoride exporter